MPSALSAGWWATSAISLPAHAQLLGGNATGCLRTLLDGGGGDGLPQVQPAFRPSLLTLMVTAAPAGGDAGYAERLLADAEADAGRLGLPLPWACVHRAGAQLRSPRGCGGPLLDLAGEWGERQFRTASKISSTQYPRRCRRLQNRFGRRHRLRWSSGRRHCLQCFTRVRSPMACDSNGHERVVGHRALAGARRFQPSYAGCDTTATLGALVT